MRDREERKEREREKRRKKKERKMQSQLIAKIQKQNVYRELMYLSLKIIYKSLQKILLILRKFFFIFYFFQTLPVTQITSTATSLNSTTSGTRATVGLKNPRCFSCYKHSNLFSLNLLIFFAYFTPPPCSFQIL